MPQEHHSYQLTVEELPQHERAFTTYDRVGALFSHYYRDRTAALACNDRQAQVLRRCVTSKDRRLLFVKNCKAACTTGTELVYHYDNGRYVGGSAVHERRDLAQGQRATRHHMAASRDPATLRVTFVREPLAGVVSAFVMIFVDRTPYTRWARAEHGMWRLGYDPDGSIDRNFDVFLEYLAQSFALDAQHANPHWRLQTFNIAHGEIDYGLIGRVERLRDDIRLIGERLGHRFPNLDQETGPHFHRGRDARSLLAITAAQRARVRTLYARDYETFGY